MILQYYVLPMPCFLYSPHYAQLDTATFPLQCIQMPWYISECHINTVKSG